ncbi:tetratricopeptide repeat protein [Arenibacter sp. 6A1]|uniref:ATP-binding protein n=1 Tax=Arenibacter sp. 6A1 TaxID=2720391 RepID=UPI0014474E2C|nr:sensor histidine kinase [Arenibacter sp. 6A1]NKI25917.1 tetratricopeptide repeat protein [Arenibacter sp. 6A1]
MNAKILHPFYYGLFCLCVLLFNGCNRKNSLKDTSELSNKTDSVKIILDNLTPKSISSDLKKAYYLALTEKDDSVKSNHLSAISYELSFLNDSLYFRRANKLAIQLAKKVQDSTALANNYWDLASFLQNTSLVDSSYYYYSEALKIFDHTNDKFSAARMLYNMAVIQSNAKDYTGSEITTIQAIELLKPLQKNLNLYYCYNNLGSVANALKEYDKALDYYDKSLFYLEKHQPSSNLKYKSFNNTAMVYQEMGNHQKAISLFEKIIHQDSIYFKDTKLYAVALSNYAQSKNKLGDTTRILPLLQKALKIKDSIGEFNSLALTNFQLSEYYLGIKDTATALQYALQSKTIAKQSNNNLRLLQTLELISKIDPHNSLYYTQEYINLNDSLQLAERAVRNKFTKIRFETDEFIAQNKLLSRQRQLLLGISVAILLLAGATLIILDQRRKNQKLRFEQLQQQKNQEIFNLLLTQNQKVEEGKQLEKKRISEELHDGIIGKLFGTRLILASLNNKTDSEIIEKRAEYIKSLQNIEEEIRTISHELNKASQEKIHNFIVSIEELIHSTQESSKIECHFQYDESMDWDQLKGEIKINIYRIIQESFQNCIKHAQASRVELSLINQKDTLKIIIQDNGIGFNTKKSKKGIGLKNIHSRLKKLNGHYSIESSVNQGTQLTATIPYLLD